jgi:hypothetical protein
MSTPTKPTVRQRFGPARLVSALLLGALGALAASVPASADAGTYPMYQCGADATAAVAPGWYVYGDTTITSTALNDSCATTHNVKTPA